MRTKAITQIILVLFNLGLLITISSCCTKKYCEENSVRIELYNYSEEDVDTVIICRYPKNSNFTNPVDSFSLEVYKSSGSDYFSLPLEKIETDSDYKIYISSVKQVQEISNFQTKKESCNSCFLLVPSDKYIQVKGYQLNGQTFSGQLIKIYK